MTIPVKAIERLFEKLQLSYGSEFTNKWGNMNSMEVKTNWGYELSQFADNLNAIGWALQNLPEKCPNLIEFKNLCKQAPRVKNLQLEAPKAPVEIVDAEISKIVSSFVKQPQSKIDHRLWAKKLKEKHEKNENLNPYQIMKYKAALNENV